VESFRFCRCCRSCFFFQAEDGIRDKLVTGVQTCALPICCGRSPTKIPAIIQIAILRSLGGGHTKPTRALATFWPISLSLAESGRSEERRVGKECRSPWWLYP